MTSNWQFVQLGQLISIKHGFPFKSEYFSEDLTERPIVVNIGNFKYTGGFRFDETTLKEYRDHYPEAYNLVPGDILLVMTCQTPGGEILGIPGKIPDDGRIYLHNQRLGKVELIDNTSVDLDFLYWLFVSPEFNRFLVTTASGTKILHTSPNRIEAFQFRLPPIDEQRTIASILGSLDDKIELNRRMNATLEATARALFQSWFVDFDPVRAKMDGRQPDGLDAATAALFPDRLVDSALGPIPEGWQIKSLDEIADFLNGLALQKYPAEGDDYLPALKIRELRQGFVDSSSDHVSLNIDPAYVIHDGDVVFSWSGSLLVDIWSGGNAALNQHLFKVSSPYYPKWFYYLWVKHHLAEFQQIAADKATTMGHIQRHHLSSAICAVPPNELLRFMSDVIVPLIDEQLGLDLNTRSMAETRDALLPRLLSGEIIIKSRESVDPDES